MKFTLDETKAIEASLPNLGKHVAETGLAAKSFNDMSREEILGLSAFIIREFREQWDDLTDIPF